MKTFTAGTTPKETITEAMERICPTGFRMSLVRDDAKIVAEAVNQGIDSYLEAITSSTFEESAGRLKCLVSVEDMPVLLRRLWEMDTEGAWSLRVSILSVLEVDEV